jgi:hypothetical protein
MGSIGTFFLQLLDDMPWENSYQSIKRGGKRITLDSLKSSHLFTNRARDGRWRRLTSLLKAVGLGRVTMGLLTHGLKLCLATLEALPQVSGSVHPFGELSF